MLAIKRGLLPISFLLAAFFIQSCSNDLIPDKIVFKNYAPPVTVKWMGKTILGYELHAYNFNESGFDIVQVDIHADSHDGRLIKSYSGKEFTEIYEPYTGKHIVNGAILFLWPEFAEGQKIPDVLYHKIYFNNRGGIELITDEIKVPVIKKEPVVIDPPVRGKNWWWANGPSNNDLQHRRTVMSFQSRPFDSQRFAVDLIKFSDDGYIADPAANPESLTNEHHYSYGEKVYAVADAKVFNFRDGLPDIKPGALPPLNLDNADGNFVILEIVFQNGNSTDTVYANYAHLKNGSVRVKIGDTVKRGDVIGRLGNSGNTTGPHLHFHIMGQGPGIFLSQGLPYTISSFQLKGTILNPDELEAARTPWKVQRTSRQIISEMPALNYLVDF